MAPQTVDSKIQPGQPRDEAPLGSGAKSSRNLLQGFISRIPLTKQFDKRIGERQEELYDARLDKYENLTSIDSALKQHLANNFKYCARQLSEVDSWIEAATLWAKALALSATIALCILAPPLLSRLFPQLVSSGFHGFWGLSLELLLSAAASPLAAVILCFPFFLFASTSKRVDEFFNLNGVGLFWWMIVAFAASLYLYELYAGRFAAWPDLFRYRLTFYLIAEAGFCFPLFFILAGPVRVLMRALQSRKYALETRAVIIDQLLHVLSLIELSDYKEAIWPGFSTRTSLAKRLEIVASCIENHFPSHFVTGVPEMDRWTNLSALEMANGVREMTKWVFAPTTYTLQDFKARVGGYFAAALVSEWGKFDRVPADKLTRRQSIRVRAASTVAALLTAAVPILLLILLKRLRLVAEPLSTYLTVGSYIWAALSLLSRLDPQYAAKLGALKDLTKTLPFSKGGDDN